MKYLPVIALLFIASIAYGQGRLDRGELIVDSLSRSYVIYVPASATGQKLPVVISLHGGLSTGRQMMNAADFRPLADRENF